MIGSWANGKLRWMHAWYVAFTFVLTTNQSLGERSGVTGRHYDMYMVHEEMAGQDWLDSYTLDG